MDKNVDENNFEEDTTVDSDQGEDLERMNAEKKGKLSKHGTLKVELGTINQIIVSVAGIDLTTSDAGLQSEDSKPEKSLIAKIRNYFSKRRNAAKNSDRLSRILEIVAEATGITPIKAFSLAFKEAAAYLTNKEREGKVDRLLDMVSSMSYLNGCKRILEKFRAMSSRDEEDMSVWANEFYRNKDNFSESLSDFNKENVRNYLKYVYEMKCEKNMKQLFEAFGFLVHSRTLYNQILATYYTNITEHIHNENPNLVPEKRILKEIEQCERDIEEIGRVADSIVGVECGGFIAMMNSKSNLGYVPRFQDISDENCIGEFNQNDLVIKPMDSNVIYKLFSKEGKDSLYSSKPTFIKCKSPMNDYKRIVAFKDGNAHQASGFRTQFKNGAQCLGKVTSTHVELLYLGENIEIYLNGNMKQWQKDLVWKDMKGKKGFSELKYFEKTPEYYVMNPREVKLDMDIHEAARQGNIGTIKYHLFHGVEVDEKDIEGKTALMHATWQGHLDIVTFLIEKEANLNDKSNDGWTPLMLAAKKGYLEIVIFLIDNGANINDKSDKGGTSLIFAAYWGHLEIVTVLITNRASINDRDFEGKTPLIYAATRGHLEIVSVLLKHGASVNTKDNRGYTAVRWSALKYPEVAKLLRSYGGTK